MNPVHLVLIKSFLTFVNNFVPNIVLDATTIKEAMLFSAKHKRQDLSAADCIGYVMAIKLGLKFLTGDRQFRDMAGVEFVK